MLERSEKHIVIAGLVRDCAHSLPFLLNNLEKLAERFNESSFIFIENDSVDKSKRILSEFARARTNCFVEHYDNICKVHAKRTDRLAVLRNRILEIADQLTKDPDDTFLLLLDLDGVNKEIDADRISKYVFEDTEDWAGLFANQRLDYYDLWALRHPNYCSYDIWEKVRNRPKSMSKDEAIKTFITSIRFSLPEDGGFIEVESAFGGMGLYRFAAIKGCKYVGLDDNGNQICEHVAFNAEVRARGGKLYIDCGWINSNGTELHTPDKSILSRKLERFMSRVSRMTDRVMKCFFSA
ncbi:hypothetical protein [Roseibium sp. M-1]